jgi:SAM-dependent methyltransferase
MNGGGGPACPDARPAAGPPAEPGWRRRLACSLCHGPALDPVLTLPPSPVASAFAADRATALAEPTLPLSLWRCRTCGHVQLGQIVDRFRVFARALAAHGGSPAMVAHLAAFAEDLMQRYPSSREALVIDIGCNDGTLLKAFEDAGRRVQGIEPAVDVAGLALGRGIRTHAGFFLPAVAERLEEERGRAAYVIAQMAFAEAERPAELLEAVSLILARDGVFAFEVAYLGDLLEQAAFDGITHRVLDYHALAPLVRFFAANDFEVIAARRTPPHRGSLRGIVQRLGGPHRRDPSVDMVLAWEEAAGLDDPATYRRFADEVAARTAAIAARLAGLRDAGLSIAGYGATACATTLLHALAAHGFAADGLSGIFDDTPEKAGLFLPGAGVPIIAGRDRAAQPPDVLVVLAWNHADAILPRLAGFLAGGGRVIVPLPDLREL